MISHCGIGRAFSVCHNCRDHEFPRHIIWNKIKKCYVQLPPNIFQLEALRYQGGIQNDLVGEGGGGKGKGERGKGKGGRGKRKGKKGKREGGKAKGEKGGKEERGKGERERGVRGRGMANSHAKYHQFVTYAFPLLVIRLSAAFDNCGNLITSLLSTEISISHLVSAI